MPKKNHAAIIDLYLDEGGTVCTAYLDVPGLKEGKLDDPTEHEVYYYSVGSEPEQSEQQDETDERTVTLNVLGWLWQHGYTSAEWATEELSGHGKPNWAKKQKYEWGEKA